ncbi:MAG: serine/threonine protein kinase [Proteobacteria bacterium]|nr:serine/threonine protein kinase [Pseudomonadota bacterium]
MIQQDLTRAALAQFDNWAQLPEADRAQWLMALADREPAVHGRLMALIVADQKANEQPFLQLPEPVGSLIGTQFGPWRVMSLIGTGGMAQVWLARRVDGLYEGVAAIKLLRLASLDAGANERFAREGQMLARLSHPNIARLLDAGVSAGGERFLILEYVDGERIDAWCNRQQLTVAQRMALFSVVCGAVAHAHENLIVHRDLKPSNIFVTTDGEVKLLDFGIAKLMDDDTGTRHELTRNIGPALTPGYAAPEQLAGGPISTATDVFALGVVLYELLNGAPPPPRNHADDTPEPLWNLPAEAVSLAAQRSATVKGLRKELRGDVATVVAKAMQGIAAKRYHSPLELANDLQRVLDNRPVQARPDSLLYRARKWSRRHVLAISMAAVVLLSIAGGLTGTFINARAAAREGQRAVAVKRFLLDLFEQARGSVRGGTEAREATLSDVLSAGADRIDSAFASQPEIRDEVFQILVELYTDTGSREQTERLARRRLAAARAAFGPADPRTAPAQVMLGAVLVNYGQNQEAHDQLDAAQRLLDAAGDHTSIERARLLRWQGALADATSTTLPWASHPLRQAAILLRDRYPKDDELLATLVQLPRLACHYGYPDEALEDADELFERTLTRYGKDNVYFTEATVLRANLLQMTNRAGEAGPLLEQALPQMRKYVGERSPNVVAVLAHLAEAYEATGRTAEAEQTLASAQQMVEQDPGNGHTVEILARSRKRIAELKAGRAPRCGATS